jgi:hypothetical protein
VRNLQRQVSFPIVVYGVPVHRVVLDFWYFEKRVEAGVETWALVIADAKSEYTRSLQAWKRAKALFHAAYGIICTEL